MENEILFTIVQFIALIFVNFIVALEQSLGSRGGVRDPSHELCECVKTFRIRIKPNISHFAHRFLAIEDSASSIDLLFLLSCVCMNLL